MTYRDGNHKTVYFITPLLSEIKKNTIEIIEHMRANT